MGQILISKTAPCFKIEVLKLLKLLLIDSKDEITCDTTSNYASSFLKIKGVEILLYLYINGNSTLDIKSMALKLIDALSQYNQSSNLNITKIESEIIPFLSSNFSTLNPPIDAFLSKDLDLSLNE